MPRGLGEIVIELRAAIWYNVHREDDIWLSCFWQAGVGRVAGARFPPGRDGVQRRICPIKSERLK